MAEKMIGIDSFWTLDSDVLVSQDIDMAWTWKISKVSLQRLSCPYEMIIGDFISRLHG